MQYVQSSIGSVLIPKLLGIYERELYPILEAALGRQPDLVVDVGAAEGYYAVGIARALPNTQVIAFEGEEAGQELMREMASLNGIKKNLNIRGLCDPHGLENALSEADNALVIIDVEGYEETLVDPQVVPSLNKCELIIELHDFIIPNVTERIIERLCPTHKIARIDQTKRTIRDFPFRSFHLAVLPERYTLWVVNEFRPVQMHWLHCTPN